MKKEFCWAKSAQEGTTASGCAWSFCVMLVLAPVIVYGRDEAKFRLYLVLFLFLIVPAFRFAMVCSRRFRVQEHGLELCYAFGFKRFYPWDQFTDFGLCKVHYGSGRNTHTLAIRLVVGGESFGPRQACCAREHWQTRFYEVQHMGKIITIYHTPERYAELLKFCPLIVIDYTNLPEN